MILVLALNNDIFSKNISDWSFINIKFRNKRPGWGFYRISFHFMICLLFRFFGYNCLTIQISSTSSILFTQSRIVLYGTLRISLIFLTRIESQSAKLRKWFLVNIVYNTHFWAGIDLIFLLILNHFFLFFKIKSSISPKTYTL